jgi:cytochrome c553
MAANTAKAEMFMQNVMPIATEAESGIKATISDVSSPDMHAAGKPTCGICHGPDLKGLGPIPGIAGRSPSYLIRHLYDFRAGVRGGAGSALMKPVIEKLSMDDMISLAAYAASLNP